VTKPKCDLFGFSLGGILARQIARNRPSTDQMILVGTAPRGGEDIIIAVGKMLLAFPSNQLDRSGNGCITMIVSSSSGARCPRKSLIALTT
jgi:pimeloyl-ACP methyl ester carboxylesterase